MRVLYCGYKPSVEYMFHRYYLPVCSLPFYFLNSIFWKTEVFNSDEVQFTNFFKKIICPFCVLVKKLA